MNDLHGQRGRSRAARASVLRQQPTTVLQALRIHGVGRCTTRRLLTRGLLTDPDNVQVRALPNEQARGDEPEDRRALH